MDDHDFEHEYYHVAEDLKWNLIESKIANDQTLDVLKEEIIDTAKLMIAGWVY